MKRVREKERTRKIQVREWGRGKRERESRLTSKAWKREKAGCKRRKRRRKRRGRRRRKRRNRDRWFLLLVGHCLPWCWMLCTPGIRVPTRVLLLSVLWPWTESIDLGVPLREHNRSRGHLTVYYKIRTYSRSSFSLHLPSSSDPLSRERK